jgi:hypothetical protein
MKKTEQEITISTLDWTLGRILRDCILSAALRGDNIFDKSDMTGILSVRFMEVARDAGATPTQTVAAMVNFLSATIAEALEKGEERRSK